ncbi:MAG: cache domain-containing protein [Anaerolineales bacterium]|nr:cache domain-containing protein [Anaerolineales bacterium]MDW8446428.1 cache domain-containing protein [Anaerolineales bacterium]
MIRPSNLRLARWANHMLNQLFPAPFQFALIVAFTLVAALSIGVGAWGISKTIDQYLIASMTERVSRDMRLAQAFYSAHLKWIEDTAMRLANDALVVNFMHRHPDLNQQGEPDLRAHLLSQTRGLLDQGNHAIVIIDRTGKVKAGYLVEGGEILVLEHDEQYSFLPAVVQKALQDGEVISSTEVLGAEVLQSVSLAEKARIPLLETPRAAPQLYDPREGSAGLVLISVAPVSRKGETLGAIAVFHLVNNDFTLVDRIKSVAGVDTVTIFLGDQRISTNVLTEDGKRAIGTRLSAEVGEVVLYKGESFAGPAFVVNQNYITRYDPLFDHQGNIVGILYVGASQERFLRLLTAFNRQVVFIALISILVTFALAIPVSGYMTRPLGQLRRLVQTSQKVSAGDLSARAPVSVGGEVGLVARSFNAMLDALQNTQDKLIQSEKLASLGQLAAGVAHELNNPLATILLYADILRREVTLDEQHRADLETVISETQRCKQIVSALLNFARQTRVDARPISLNDLIFELIEIEKRHPRYEKITFELNLDPELPLAELDPAQMREVFLNLIHNAADAMPEGGKILIRTAARPDGMVTFEVEDEGRGIPPEHLSKLFTPFFTTKPVGKGTGLGLAITYGIVKMHRGQISVMSEVGKGTTFTVSLPLKLSVPKERVEEEGLIG